jgi:hypothetical protein
MVGDVGYDPTSTRFQNEGFAIKLIPSKVVGKESYDLSSTCFRNTGFTIKLLPESGVSGA